MPVDARKKSGRGRPPVESEEVRARIAQPLLGRLDAWIASQPDPRPSRPEAVRRVLAEHLASAGRSASLDRQIVEQRALIDDMPTHDAPSPEAGMTAMNKAIAENELVDMKNERTKRKRAKRG